MSKQNTPQSIRTLDKAFLPWTRTKRVQEWLDAALATPPSLDVEYAIAVLETEANDERSSVATSLSIAAVALAVASTFSGALAEAGALGTAAIIIAIVAVVLLLVATLLSYLPSSARTKQLARLYDLRYMNETHSPSEMSAQAVFRIRSGLGVFRFRRK